MSRVDTRPIHRTRRTRLVVLAATALLASSCSFAGGGDDDGDAADTVVLLTHGDFHLPDDVVAAFEEESGATLEVRPSNGVGELANQVSEEAGDPSGDVVFGIDNTFASRVLDSGALAPYEGELPDGVAEYALPGDDEGALVPVDNGNVCVNVDDTWFAAEGIAPPRTLEDLAEPRYRGLFVVPGASTSSPGMAFLLTTVAAFGEEWPQYWERLLANETLVVDGWSDAYNTEFTQGGGDGDRPVVVSYDSSPAFTVDDAGRSSTSALLETCYLQVEHAAVLDGAANEDGARELVDFLLGEQVQQALPTSMYVFPVVAGTEVPEEWAAHAPRPDDPWSVDPAEIEQRRDEWLLEWTDVISR